MPLKYYSNQSILRIFSLFISLVFITCLSCNKITYDDGSTIDTDISITSLKPSHGPFDTIDTLIGKGFDKIPEFDSVMLNGKKLTLISKSPTQVIVRIPSLAGTGNIDIWYQGKLIRGPVFTYDSLLFVSTLAGSSTESGGADGQGLAARFNNLQGITLDPQGNIYVVDQFNNSIRKITSGGLVSTLAGGLNVNNGFANGSGAVARFSHPTGITMGTDGFLYVGDQFNYKVRQISLAGQVSTKAGVSWNLGPLSGQIDGDISVATFNTPSGLTTDQQKNVYVADAYNNKIRKITPAGIVSTYAGVDYYNLGHKDGPAATALFMNPFAIASDVSGNLYVIDGDAHWLRKISTDGIVSTLLGPEEPAITGYDELFSTYALALDKNGNLFFSIKVGIIKMTPDGTIIRYATGGIGNSDGPSTLATYSYIRGIAIDDAGTLYITDNHRVRKIAWQ